MTFVWMCKAFCLINMLLLFQIRGLRYKKLWIDYKLLFSLQLLTITVFSYTLLDITLHSYTIFIVRKLQSEVKLLWISVRINKNFGLFLLLRWWSVALLLFWALLYHLLPYWWVQEGSCSLLMRVILSLFITSMAHCVSLSVPRTLYYCIWC